MRFHTPDEMRGPEAAFMIDDAGVVLAFVQPLARTTPDYSIGVTDLKTGEVGIVSTPENPNDVAAVFRGALELAAENWLKTGEGAEGVGQSADLPRLREAAALLGSLPS